MCKQKFTPYTINAVVLMTLGCNLAWYKKEWWPSWGCDYCSILVGLHSKYWCCWIGRIYAMPCTEVAYAKSSKAITYSYCSAIPIVHDYLCYTLLHHWDDCKQGFPSYAKRSKCIRFRCHKVLLGVGFKRSNLAADVCWILGTHILCIFSVFRNHYRNISPSDRGCCCDPVQWEVHWRKGIILSSWCMGIHLILLWIL